MRIRSIQSKTLLMLAGAVCLGACQAEEEEVEYTTDVEDLSGGELIVTEEDPDAVDVELPETPMTPEAVEEPAS